MANAVAYRQSFFAPGHSRQLSRLVVTAVQNRWAVLYSFAMKLSGKRFLRSSGTRLAVLALLSCASCAPEVPQRIVLVTIDTLRLDTFAGRPRGELIDMQLPEDYAGYFTQDGEPLVTAMPLTRQWAEAGARFDRCYTVSPVTQPAHASLFTGLFPWQHGVTRNGQVLGTEFQTVAEILNENGWETSAVVASYPLTKVMGFAQGFDQYEEKFRLSRPASEWNGVEIDKFYSLGKSVTDRALKLLNGFQGERQFLWVHYFDPHAPYGDTESVAKGIPLAKLTKTVAAAKRIDVAKGGIKRAQRAYEADCFSLDGELARLLDRLRADEKQFDTHVILVADHGESFGEDNSLGHGRRLTEPQLRIPLVIHSPRATKGLYGEPVGTVDVAKTLLTLAGRSSAQFQGRDLTAPLNANQLVAGMRTSFKGSVKDRRVEGEPVTLVGERWFLFEEGRLVSGDRDAVYWGDNEANPASGSGATRATALFGLFADQMTGAVELDDEEARATLEAMGYAGNDSD